MKYLTVFAILALTIVGSLARITVGPPMVNDPISSLTFYYKDGYELDDSILEAVQTAVPDLEVHVVPCSTYQTACSQLPNPDREYHVVLSDENGSAQYPGIISAEELVKWLTVDCTGPHQITQNPSIWGNFVSSHVDSGILVRLYEHSVTSPDASLTRIASRLRSQGILTVWATWDDAGKLIQASGNCVNTPGLWYIEKNSCAKYDRRTTNGEEESEEAVTTSTFSYDDVYRWVLRLRNRIVHLKTTDEVDRLVDTITNRQVILYGFDHDELSRLNHSIHHITDLQVAAIENVQSDSEVTLAEYTWEKLCSEELTSEIYFISLDANTSAKYCVQEGDIYKSGTHARISKREKSMNGTSEMSTERVYVQLMAIFKGNQSSIADLWDIDTVQYEEESVEEAVVDTVGGFVDFDTAIEEQHGKNESDPEDAPFKLGGETFADTELAKSVVMFGEKIVKIYHSAMEGSVKLLEKVAGSEFDTATKIVFLICAVGVIIALCTSICIPRAKPRHAVKDD